MPLHNYETDHSAPSTKICLGHLGGKHFFTTALVYVKMAQLATMLNKQK